MNGEEPGLNNRPNCGCGTEVMHVAAEAIGEIDHCARPDARLTPVLDSVQPRLRVKVPLNDVGKLSQIRLGAFRAVTARLEALLAGEEHLEAGRRRAKIARHAEEIARLRALAVDDVILCRLANDGNRDHQFRGCRHVAAYDDELVPTAGLGHTRVEHLQLLYGDVVRQRKRNRGVTWLCIHGHDIADVGGDGLPAEVAHRHERPIEMDALHQRIRRDHVYTPVAHAVHGRVVPDALNQRVGHICAEHGSKLVNQPKLTDLADGGEGFGRGNHAEPEIKKRYSRSNTAIPAHRFFANRLP